MAQVDPSYFGKILRLDVDQSMDQRPYFGLPPPGPFANVHEDPSDLSKVFWAKGLRNPWRMAFDRLSGDLYIADSGHHAREEINFQPANSPGGENYGWKIMEGTRCFAEGGSCGRSGRVALSHRYTTLR